MARSRVGPRRSDPYESFRFRLRWGGRYVAGFSEVSALEGGSAAVDSRDGDLSSHRKLVGLAKSEPISLKRGVAHDPEFEKWASVVQHLDSGPGPDASTEALRRDLVLEVYDEAGRLALEYRLQRCWVSRFQALPDLDAGANAVAIERMTLENEGWERDDRASEPSERSR